MGRIFFISVMNQYTPVWKNEKFPELNRKVTRREYEKVLDAAIELGIENGYFQEGETAEESFIPAFDYEGGMKEKSIMHESDDIVPEDICGDFVS